MQKSIVICDSKCLLHSQTTPGPALFVPASIYISSHSLLHFQTTPGLALFVPASIYTCMSPAVDVMVSIVFVMQAFQRLSYQVTHNTADIKRIDGVQFIV